MPFDQRGDFGGPFIGEVVAALCDRFARDGSNTNTSKSVHHVGQEGSETTVACDQDDGDVEGPALLLAEALVRIESPIHAHGRGHLAG